MVVVAWISLATVVAFVIAQSYFVLGFVRMMRRAAVPPATAGPMPRVAVVLALRGPDPFIAQTLRGLMGQDYANFHVFIVLDSEHDPAREDVEKALAHTGAEHVTVSALTSPKTTCSLKCSALVQAIGDLDGEYEIVAFLDGDSPPPRCWLRDLVEPLRDPGVGATTGNRWYMPDDSRWGSLVRYFWNCGAVVQMWVNEMVWAGSMALRVDVIHGCGLLDVWSRSLSVDATVYRQLAKHGYRVAFAPTVMLINREGTSLPQFATWVRRQLVTARLYHPGWRIVLLHAGFLNAVQLIAAALFVWALAAQDMTVLVLGATTLAVYSVAGVASSVALEHSVRRVNRRNGVDSRWLGTGVVVKIVFALILTHWVYTHALLSSLNTRRVSWRGVDYELGGPEQIRLVHYSPYASAPEASGTMSVL